MECNIFFNATKLNQGKGKNLTLYYSSKMIQSFLKRAAKLTGCDELVKVQNETGRGAYTEIHLLVYLDFSFNVLGFDFDEMEYIDDVKEYLSKVDVTGYDNMEKLIGKMFLTNSDKTRFSKITDKFFNLLNRVEDPELFQKYVYLFLIIGRNASSAIDMALSYYGKNKH